MNGRPNRMILAANQGATTSANTPPPPRGGGEGAPRHPRPLPHPAHRRDQPRERQADDSFGQDRQRRGEPGQERGGGSVLALPAQMPVHGQRDEQRERDVLPRDE